MKTAIHSIGKQPDGSSTIIVGIPGGPCFSSKTMEGLAELCNRVPVFLLDPPGTGTAIGLDRSDTYESVLSDIEEAILSLRAQVILVGHSFGGIQAIDIASRNCLKLAGLVCIASPISLDILKISDEVSVKFETRELIEASKAFQNNPSKQTFLDWNLQYNEMYFSKSKIESGNELIRKDRMSFEQFLQIGKPYGLDDQFPNKIRSIKCKKLFLAGELDRMFPVQDLVNEAKKVEFDCRIIKGAGHFVPFEEPAQTCAAITDYFLL